MKGSTDIKMISKQKKKCGTEYHRLTITVFLKADIYKP